MQMRAGVGDARAAPEFADEYEPNEARAGLFGRRVVRAERRFICFHRGGCANTMVAAPPFAKGGVKLSNERGCSQARTPTVTRVHPECRLCNDLDQGAGGGYHLGTESTGGGSSNETMMGNVWGRIENPRGMPSSERAGVCGGSEVSSRGVIPTTERAATFVRSRSRGGRDRETKRDLLGCESVWGCEHATALRVRWPDTDVRQEAGEGAATPFGVIGYQSETPSITESCGTGW